MAIKRRRAPRWLIVAFAIPVIVAVYLAVFSRRVVSVGRGLVVGFLAVTVIGSVYAEVAARTAIAPARRQPLPLTAALVLALAIIGSGLPSAPVRAGARSDAESVVQAALVYKGARYVLGAEGPKVFDCSGLVYRAFKDAGELPLIGGRRLRAIGYYKWFASRGLSSRTEGRRGDLVVFGRGAHIGIYLGDGRVISALIPRVKIHGLNELSTNKFTAFLHVPWGTTPSDIETTGTDMTTTTFINRVPKGGARNGGTDNGQSGRPTNDRGGDAPATGYAFGSLNVRENAGPSEEIISWISRGATVEILKAGKSPGGALWYYVRKPSGREGWVWSGWLRVVSGSVDG
jgi:cell wall-associated NlpC family hydrolase